MAPGSLLQSPMDTLAGAHRHHAAVRERVAGGHLPVLFAQRDGAGIARQAVKIGAKETGEALQFVQRPGAFEGFRVQFQGGVGGVQAGAAAGAFLGGALVRGAVGTQEQPRVATGGRLQQRLAVPLALQYRQAIVVRAYATGDNQVSRKSAPKDTRTSA